MIDIGATSIIILTQIATEELEHYPFVDETSKPEQIPPNPPLQMGGNIQEAPFTKGGKHSGSPLYKRGESACVGGVPLYKRGKHSGVPLF